MSTVPRKSYGTQTNKGRNAQIICRLHYPGHASNKREHRETWQVPPCTDTTTPIVLEPARCWECPSTARDCLRACRMMISLADPSVWAEPGTNRQGHVPDAALMPCDQNRLERSSPALANGAEGQVPTLSHYREAGQLRKKQLPGLVYNSKNGVRTLAAECLLASCCFSTSQPVPPLLLSGKSCLLGEALHVQMRHF